MFGLGNYWKITERSQEGIDCAVLWEENEGQIAYISQELLRVDIRKNIGV